MDDKTDGYIKKINKGNKCYIFNGPDLLMKAEYNSLQTTHCLFIKFFCGALIPPIMTSTRVPKSVT